MRTYEDVLREHCRDIISTQLANAKSLGVLAIKQLVLVAMTWIDLMAVPDTETPIDPAKVGADAKEMN